MQYSTLLVAFMATLAYSQSVSDLVGQTPKCAVTCLATAATAGGCGLTDYKCQCGANKAAITASATPCVLAACTQDEALKVLSITNQICALAGSSGSAATTTGYTPVATQIGDGQVQVPASLAPASSFASVAPAAPTKTAAPPAQVSTGAGSKLQAGAAMAGAAVLAAFAL